MSISYPSNGRIAKRDIHLETKALKLTQARVVACRGPTCRDHRCNKIKQVIKCIDKDQPVHWIAKMPRKGKCADDRDNSQDGESRCNTFDSSQGAKLRCSEVHGGSDKVIWSFIFRMEWSYKIIDHISTQQIAFDMQIKDEAG